MPIAIYLHAPPSPFSQHLLSRHSAKKEQNSCKTAYEAVAGTVAVAAAVAGAIELEGGAERRATAEEIIIAWQSSALARSPNNKGLK